MSKRENKSQSVREEALANARRAREAIGQDTLDKLAEIMARKQQSAIEQARRAADANPDKALDTLKYMLKERD